jgi:hypothetical protein
LFIFVHMYPGRIGRTPLKIRSKPSYPGIVIVTDLS